MIEGDHGSAYFHPKSAAADTAIRCLVDLQRESGGNALVGRELYPLMMQAGYADIRVSPRMVYVDASRPALVDGFTRQTFAAMVEGPEYRARTRHDDNRRMGTGDNGSVPHLEPDGVFCYTFFKATGTV